MNLKRFEHALQSEHATLARRLAESESQAAAAASQAAQAKREAVEAAQQVAVLQQVGMAGQGMIGDDVIES
jgi:hypothetical protein